MDSMAGLDLRRHLLRAVIARPVRYRGLGRRMSEAARIDGTGWAGGIEVTACSWRGPTGFVPKRIREKHD